MSAQGPWSKPVSPCLAGGAGEREKVSASPEGLLLMASSQRDMEDWVQAIRRVIWAPFGGGTARSLHAHPLEPLRPGNRAPPPARAGRPLLPRTPGRVQASQAGSAVLCGPPARAGPWCTGSPGRKARATFQTCPPAHRGFCMLASAPGPAVLWCERSVPGGWALGVIADASQCPSLCGPCADTEALPRTGQQQLHLLTSCTHTCVGA